ncbi:Ldh family oxidoreductase [Metabacillus arenae]|uniref:Ldh family oxidoreductase n=1 Tax=Metabacillus arenae TaxID=2771434 RepID=A0A926NMM5_9BACI|nr:Ldh family oxidoreductase [Metabacillus arenae]MBD1380601.1 Ldh family oxidoreductase [Metabacillus arenae]
MRTYQAKDLKKFCTNILLKMNVPKEDAAVTAEALVQANLEGVDSHGISRLSIYSERVMEGRINPNPRMEIKQKSHSVLVVNGDNGLGQAVAYHSLKKGIKLAKDSGICAIGINNSNHFGTASYYCQLACKENLGMIGFTNSPPGIAPWGGKKAFFGTNPIAFGFPRKDQPPVVIDLSTSIVARGKIILAAKQGEAIPDGWAMDENGEETNDPVKALKGAVLPLGGAKGSALALAVEILTGVLSGAAFGPHIQNIYDDQADAPANVGHFFILIDIEKFMPYEQFEHYLSMLLDEMKHIATVPGVEEIRYPGERRAREYSIKKEQGIALSSQVEQELSSLANELDVIFPTSNQQNEFA